MSEPTWTIMHIGGSLPAAKIDELLECAECFYECDGDFDEPSIREAAAEKRSLMLQGQVNYGNPEALVDFCTENKLPFWLQFDAGPEWDPGIQFWSPEAGKVEECGASAQGNSPTISLSELRMKAESGRDLATIIEDLARFESHKVPPLTIVEPVSDEQKEAAQKPEAFCFIPDNSHGVKPGYYTKPDIVRLLRMHKMYPERIQFIADIME